MPTRKTDKPAAPAPAPLSDAQLKRLCALRATLDEERLGLDREARARATRIETIDATLATELRRRKVRTLDLGRWAVAFVKKLGSLFYKGALIEAIGQEAFDARLAQVPEREVVEITDHGRIPQTRVPRAPRRKGAA